MSEKDEQRGKEILETSNHDVSSMVNEMIDSYEDYVNNGSKELTRQMRILVIGRVVNYTHHAYRGLIDQHIKFSEDKLQKKEGISE